MPRARTPRRAHELTEDAVEHGIARLAQLDEARQAKRARCSRAARDAVSDDNDPVDSLSPVLDRFKRSGGEAVMQSTNFSEEEINRRTTYPLHTDVTFQPANIPYGLKEGRSIYFSGKHKGHGYKVEVSVLRTGKPIYCTSHHPGRVSDIVIFRWNQAFHSQNMTKSEAEKRLRDEGPLATEYPDEWALLADKGYQGLSAHFQAITPNKKRPGETVSFEQLEETTQLPMIVCSSGTTLVA
ncbi:unnamed protein product [Phytophthora fragariaefolia]|uniref:Unnamed protein product n=1 Tax=Phytophthora fragariaefolia TaxID=1490495 RepID=A0A9W7D083_9STRA|nr:unnamed protein product [Phytophthora fragariaefolia]